MTLLDDSTFSDLPSEDLPQYVPDGLCNARTPMAGPLVSFYTHAIVSQDIVMCWNHAVVIQAALSAD